MILNQLRSHKDIKKLNLNELNKLTIEIKNEIIETVKKNGGHLSSNLGSVKLILALFKVFDIEKDRVIFDIGHQAYTYKILTDRYQKFKLNRKKNGTSAFPKLDESKYDHSSPGHAGSSLSIANGYCISDIITKNDALNITIIGDGSLTTGMAYEALNLTKYINKKQIIIINNNSFSISKNVGSFSDEISRLKNKNDSEFMHYGIKLLGPVDGTNIEELIKFYQIAKNLNETVIIHVITKKGEGYKEVENNPEKYHGISSEKKENSFSKKASEVVEKIMSASKIPIITPAMIEGSKLLNIEKKYPSLLFDVGIAEESAVSMLSGISLGGIKPIIFIYSTFLQRAYDQIINDIYLQNQNALFIIDRAGIVPNDGPTHQGIYDLAHLKLFKNFKILNPINFDELEKMIKEEYYSNRTTFIRMPKSDNLIANKKFEICNNNFRYFENKKDTKLKVIALTPNLIKNVLSAREMLKKDNIYFDILSPIELKSDDNVIIEEFKNTKKIVIFEEFIKSGGYSEIISEAYMEKSIKPSIIKKQINKEIISADLEDIYFELGFDIDSIIKIVKSEYESSDIF